MKIRLFINSKLASGTNVELRKDHQHYLSKVLRCETGDEIFVFNADDGEFSAKIKSKKEVELGEQTIEPFKENKLTLIFAPVKFGKIDFLVQKATELGVTEIQPVKTRYTVVSRINYDRVSANAIEAAEQTGRITLPQINKMQDLKKLVDKWPPSQKIIFCDDSLEAKPFAEALSKMPKTSKNFAILIGPEGGFAPEETEFLKKQKFVYPATMGKRLLRAETAALAALGAFQAIKGDWN